MTIDFVRHSRKAYLCSAILLVAGAISLAIFGLNLGIDFTGGTVFHLNLQQEFTLQEVKEVLTPFGLQGMPIQTVQGRNLQGEIVDTGVAIKSPYLEEGRREEVMSAFRQHWPGLSSKDLRVESVGALIGSELTRQSLISLAAAIVAMIAYITFRFEFKFAISAIAGLLHDIAVIVAIFSILRLEVNVPFIAAILTVFGYSINDSIVVIDRIRLNIRHKPRAEYPAVVNQSINQSLVRCLNTSFTTLLVLVALMFGFTYYIGNVDLIGFVIAMIIGVVVGTYSSLFIVSPLWLDLKQREFKRSRVSGGTAN